MEENSDGRKKLQIRNSTAEFLIFQIENKEDGLKYFIKIQSDFDRYDANDMLDLR